MLKLSDQSLGAIMMSLQKSLLEQSDIVPVLKGIKFALSDTGLMIMKPPIVKFNDDDMEEGAHDFDVVCKQPSEKE